MYYQPVNKPIVFDIEIPPGHSKDELLGRTERLEMKETQVWRRVLLLGIAYLHWWSIFSINLQD